MVVGMKGMVALARAVVNKKRTKMSHLVLNFDPAIKCLSELMILSIFMG
jgi:hypothetical protein